MNNAYHPGTYELFENADLEHWRAPLEVNLLGSLAPHTGESFRS